MPHVGDVFWGHSTTRTRTLTFSCSASLPNGEADQIGQINLDGTFTPAYIRQWKWGLTALAPGSDPSTAPGVMAITPGGARACGWLLHVEDGFGGANTYDGRNDYIVTLHTEGHNDSTAECSWTLTDVRTYFELYFLDTGVAGADGDPNWGGPAVGDINPRAIGIRFFEVADEGAVVTCSISMSGPHAGGSVSCTTTLGSAFVIPGYTGGAELISSITNNLDSISGSGSFELGGDWEHIGPSSTQSYSDGFSSASLTGGSGSCSLTATYVSGPASVAGTTYLDLFGEPDRRYKVTGHLYAWDSDYPGSGTLNLYGSPVGEIQSVALAPSGTGTFSQREFGATFTDRDGTPHAFGSASDWDNVKTSLTVTGEDANDWVTMIAGKQYGVLQASHAATTTAGTIASNAHTYSGSPGNWEGYRYLKVNLKTDADGEAVTLTTDSDPAKTYTITTAGTSYADYHVDLCFPDSPAPDDDPELWDSRYPLRNDGLPHNDPSGWGIGRIRSFSFSGGTSLDVQTATLERRGSAAVLDCTPAFLDWDLTQTDESYHADGSVGSVEIIQASRCAVVNVDGRRSIIEPCSLRILETDGLGVPFWVYSGRNAADLETTLNACPGFAADHTPYTATDGWHARDGSEGANFIDGGPIYYAGWTGFCLGGGVLWSSDVPTNVLGLPIADTNVALPFQARYHEILIPPAFGDPWGDTWGDPTPVRVHKILRAPADGLVLENPAGTVVTLKDAGGTTVGTGATDAYLKFLTTDPFGKGQKDHTLVLGDAVGDFTGTWDDTQGLGTLDATQERWNARRRHRAVYRNPLVQALDALCNLHTPDGTFWRATLDSDGKLRVRTALLGGPRLGWWTTAVVSDDPQDRNACLTWDPTTNRATIVWDRDDGIHESHSDSDGRDWSDPALSSLIPGGFMAKQRHCYPEGDALYVAIVDDGGSGAGKLVGRYKGRGDVDWPDPFDLTIHADSTVDPGDVLRVGGDPDAPKGYDLDFGFTHDGRWSLSITRDGDSAASDWFSVSDGRTYLPAS